MAKANTAKAKAKDRATRVKAKVRVTKVKARVKETQAKAAVEHFREIATTVEITATEQPIARSHEEEDRTTWSQTSTIRQHNHPTIVLSW